METKTTSLPGIIFPAIPLAVGALLYILPIFLTLLAGYAVIKASQDYMQDKIIISREPIAVYLTEAEYAAWLQKHIDQCTAESS